MLTRLPVPDTTPPCCTVSGTYEDPAVSIGGSSVPKGDGRLGAVLDDPVVGGVVTRAFSPDEVACPDATPIVVRLNRFRSGSSSDFRRRGDPVPRYEPGDVGSPRGLSGPVGDTTAGRSVELNAFAVVDVV